MSNIICHPYHIVDESPLPLFGFIKNDVFIVLILIMLIIFLTWAFFIFYSDTEVDWEKFRKTVLDKHNLYRELYRPRRLFLRGDEIDESKDSKDSTDSKDTK